MAKRRLPYMPFWIDDYERDTKHLKTVEHGAYLLLLMEGWKTPSNSLPDDDDMLSRLAKVSPKEWAAMKHIVMAFWHLDGRSKRWVQKRLKKERRLAVDRKQKASDAAASRWKGKEKPHAKPMLEQCYPSITTIEKDKSFSGREDAQRNSPRIEKILEGFANG